MAKSIRSKWKRKMRAVKRERYGKKELEKLKQVVGNAALMSNDVDMKSLEGIATVVSKSDVNTSVERMDDGSRVYNKKTLRDQYGNYPVWLSSKKKKKIVHRNKTLKRTLKKKGKTSKRGLKQKH